jgi:hypothetical protein
MEAMSYFRIYVMAQHALVSASGGIAILQALCTILQKTWISHFLRARLCYDRLST